MGLLKWLRGAHTEGQRGADARPREHVEWVDADEDQKLKEVRTRLNRVREIVQEINTSPPRRHAP